MAAKLNQLTEELEAIEETHSKILSIEFFDRLENKTTKLISNEDANNVLKGQHKVFPFYFKEANFIESIEVTLDGYSSSDKVEFYWVSQFTGKPEFSLQRVEGNKATIDLNEVITGFGFRPPKKYFKNPSIQNVNVRGLSLGNFRDACDKIGRFSEIKNEILVSCNNSITQVEAKEATVAGLDDTKSTLENGISALNNQVEELSRNIATLGQQKAESESGIEEVRSKETNLNVQIQSLEDTIDQKRNESSTLNSDIESKRAELSVLKKDINQFPAEISGFVSQGGRNIWHYTALAIIPISIILCVSLAVFNGAVDLTVKYTELPTMDLVTMLGSRLPFVFITIGILTASYKLAKIFISEIMRINRQRLNLSKVSIVAKDVSSSAVAGLSFNDNEKYELETKLKMDLLKSHLKGYVHEDYDQEISLGLFNRFKLQKESQERSTNPPPQQTEDQSGEEE